jgi:osmotically-inducible protein OsmY
MVVLSLSACGDDRPETETAATDIVDPTGAKFEGVPERPANVATNAAPPGAGSRAAGTAMEDGKLSARVKSALTTQPGLKALSVDVDGASGAVTLYGTASTPAQRDLAGQLALGVDGVKSVTNHLIILKES